MSNKSFGLSQVSAIGVFFEVTGAKCMGNTLSEDHTENNTSAQPVAAVLSAKQKGRLTR